ncbi:MAG: hypothetical protein K2Y21_08945 [Phycisphaerales bacterium]|nr:hypothetical protein [Phycisphaerales bacterium]
MNLNSVMSVVRACEIDSDVASPRHVLGVVAVVALPLLLMSLSALGGCSTTEGFGNDVEKLGGNIEDSAARNK